MKIVARILAALVGITGLIQIAIGILLSIHVRARTRR